MILAIATRYRIIHNPFLTRRRPRFTVQTMKHLTCRTVAGDEVHLQPHLHQRLHTAQYHMASTLPIIRLPITGPHLLRQHQLRRLLIPRHSRKLIKQYPPQVELP